MNLKKKIIDLEKKVGTDDVETDELAKFFGDNIMGVVANCMNYFEQHGCFPPDMPEKAKELLSRDMEDDADELCEMPVTRT